jgi:hypothetical protein
LSLYRQYRNFVLCLSLYRQYRNFVLCFSCHRRAAFRLSCRILFGCPAGCICANNPSVKSPHPVRVHPSWFTTTLSATNHWVPIAGGSNYGSQSVFIYVDGNFILNQPYIKCLGPYPFYSLQTSNLL